MLFHHFLVSLFHHKPMWSWWLCSILKHLCMYVCLYMHSVMLCFWLHGHQCELNWLLACLPTGCSDPRVCPRGHYCPPKTQNYLDNPCPAGTFTEETGASAQESCKTCPEGYYCEEGTDTPLACPQGTFNPSVGQDAEADCTACTAGFACTTLGLTEPDTYCYPG